MASIASMDLMDSTVSRVSMAFKASMVSRPTSTLCKVLMAFKASMVLTDSAVLKLTSKVFLASVASVASMA